MNILFITERPLILGEAQVVPLTPLAYAKRGHQVFYVSCSNRLPDGHESIRRGHLHENITLHGVRLPGKWLFASRNRFLAVAKRFLFTPLFLAYACREARRILRHHDISLIYGYEVYGVLAARWLRARWHLPTVSRYQGTEVLQHLRSPWRRLLLWDHILALKSPGDLTIMTDDGTRGDDVLRLLRSRVKTLKFWRNGVAPLAETPPEKIVALRRHLGILPEERVLLTVSRLVDWKRVDRAIEALRGVLCVFPATRLVVVGEGPVRGELERLAEQLGVQPKVIFAGFVDNSDLSAYYALADVFLSLCDLSNVGNPLLEALRSGKGIVTLNSGATSKVIRDQENGLLIEPSASAVTRITEAVIRILEDDGLRTRLEHSARAYASREIWTWDERMSAEVEAVTLLMHDRG